MNSDTESDAAGNGMKHHNNPYGQKGRRKCDRCRERRKKCVYPLETPDQACEFCATRGYTPCEKTLGAVQRTRQVAPSQPATPTLSQMANSLETINPNAGYDDVLHTIRQHAEYIKAHGAIQAVPNPTGNRQTLYKASGIAAMYEGMYPVETFEQILERVHLYTAA